MLDWTHKITDLSEEIKVFATIFPMVSDISYVFEDLILM
jgi:hypothetical protein